MRKDFYVSLGILLTFLLALFSGGHAAPVNATAVAKIKICHATSSEENPWEVLEVPEAGLNGHGDHEDDIIPITDLNEDQVVDEEDCEEGGNGIGGGECVPVLADFSIDIAASPTNFASYPGNTTVMVTVSKLDDVNLDTIQSVSLFLDGTLKETKNVSVTGDPDSTTVTFSLAVPASGAHTITADVNAEDNDCDQSASEVFNFTTTVTTPDDGGIGGGVTVVPTTTTVVTEGIGGGVPEGIGGGTLPETGTHLPSLPLAISLLGALGVTYRFRKPMIS